MASDLTRIESGSEKVSSSLSKHSIFFSDNNHARGIRPQFSSPLDDLPECGSSPFELKQGALLLFLKPIQVQMRILSRVCSPLVFLKPACKPGPLHVGRESQLDISVVLTLERIHGGFCGRPTDLANKVRRSATKLFLWRCRRTLRVHRPFEALQSPFVVRLLPVHSRKA